MDYAKLSLQKHKEYKGKLAVTSKVPLNGREDLSTYYSPWVAEPCLEIAKDANLAYDYTWKNNSVAVVSDGSAVLGLGNIWGIAWLPVMEGKAILFKHFGNVDAVPVVLNTQDPDEIIRVVEAISPTYGWINLEDIAAPNCFYIEEELKKKLQIPVFHDDQHGTAIVVLAATINSLKLVKKDIKDIKIVISWAGAAWIAIAKLLICYGASNIVMLDRQWAIFTWRDWLNKYKEEIAHYNKADQSGDLKTVLAGSDIFVWVSQPNLLTKEDIATMADKAIVFGLSNPVPEIMPDEAKAWGAYIVATWRSDFPNQINNILAFPGIFRGALDARIPQIEEKHKIAAALALANMIKEPTVDKVIPSPFDAGIADIVAQAVKSA